MPSETYRAAATLALGLYLVGLALAVAANSASGSSAVVRTIHGRLFSPWMTPPWLDLGYDTRLTHSLAEDGDHQLELRASGDRGEPLLLPAAGMAGERAARWRRLARATAVSEADPDREALLPAAIAAGGFALLGGDDVRVRVLRHLPPDRRDVIAGLADPAGRETEAYAARVRIVNGAVQLIKATPRNELAPLVEEQSP